MLASRQTLRICRPMHKPSIDLTCTHMTEIHCMTSKSGKHVNKIAQQVCTSASFAEGEDAHGHTCTKGTNAFKGAAFALLLSCPGVQDCHVKAQNDWRLFLMLPVVHTFSLRQYSETMCTIPGNMYPISEAELLVLLLV